MAKRNRRKAAKVDNEEIEEDESGLSNSKSVLYLGSSDDDEANEDLSLKIVEQALLKQAAKLNESRSAEFDVQNDVTVVDLSSLSSPANEIAAAGGAGAVREEIGDMKSDSIVKKRKKKKTKSEKVIVANDEEDSQKAETVDKVGAPTTNTVEYVDPKAVDISDNIVLRKLLRGPRYFDLPDSGWETCYNCGEGGHMAVNCPSATKRKKPCFVCGSLDHGARKCPKAHDCFICKKGGHHAKDCPDKYKSSFKNGKICLRCGDSGHDMFYCSNDYSHDDLKEIQCYVCKSFGHLCCANFVDTSPREVSCYRCGQLGHTGLSCGKSHGGTMEATGIVSPSLCYKCGEQGHFARECTNSSKARGKSFGEIWGTTDVESPSSCYKCGGVGHFARECSNSSKVGKRRHDKENKNYPGFMSAPFDNDKAFLKKKKVHDGEKELTTPLKEKHRRNSQRSPSTPSNKGQIFALTAGGHLSGSQSSKMKISHRFSASRFNNNGSNEPATLYCNNLYGILLLFWPATSIVVQVIN
ncbi:hypothetical protein SLA2020_417410 [Shorea laevis]